MQIYCEQCGLKLRENTKFCKKCGAAVDYIIAETPTRPAAADGSGALNSDDSDAYFVKNRQRWVLIFFAWIAAFLLVANFTYPVTMFELAWWSAFSINPQGILSETLGGTLPILGIPWLIAHLLARNNASKFRMIFLALFTLVAILFVVASFQNNGIAQFDDSSAEQFDVGGARRAGYNLSDVAEYFNTKCRFDVEGARNAGYSDAEIIVHVNANYGVLCQPQVG
jgi:zinc-ribbon domain